MARSLRRFLWLLFLFCPVLLSVLLLIVSWLDLGRSHTVPPELDAATARQLEEASERCWPPDHPSQEIPERDWPPEFRRFDPNSVRVTPEGVYIKCGSFFVEEWGLFVLPGGSAFRPGQHRDPSYSHLKGRVYWYRITG
jgi:hypothetical protein